MDCIKIDVSDIFPDMMADIYDSATNTVQSKHTNVMFCWTYNQKEYN